MRSPDEVIGRFDSLRPCGDGFMARCPAHEDRNPSLHITMDSDRLLLHCHAGCKVKDILDAVGLTFADLGGERGDRQHRKVGRPPVDAALRDRVYRAFLAGLDLSQEHVRDLQLRGLEDPLSARGYRSLDAICWDRALSHVAAAVGDEAVRVPGFFWNGETDSLDCVKVTGMAIPVRDANARVVGIQVRTGGSPKYVWFSGGSSPSVGTPVHFPLAVPRRSKENGKEGQLVPEPMPVVRITEGPLKADAIMALDPSVPCLAIPGVTAGGQLRSVFRRLGVREVRLAFDSDYKSNSAVRRAVYQIGSSLHAAGFKVWIETWEEADGKGLDDLLLAGKQPTVVPLFDAVTGGFVNALPGVEAEDADDTGRLLERKASDVTPTETKWLWPSWLPLGAVSIVESDGGLGKTTALLDVAARLTRGDPMPDGSRGLPEGYRGKLLFCSAEDATDSTLVPRLIAAGADLDRCFLVEGVVEGWNERLLSFPLDVAELEASIRRNGATLVVIDPLMAFIDRQLDSHKDQAVRAMLAPLSVVARNTGAAIVLVRHLNKDQGKDAKYRGMGSIGITSHARSVVQGNRSETLDGTVLEVVKCNLSKPPEPLLIRLETAENGQPKVVWSPVAREQVNQSEVAVLTNATLWLRGLLESGPVKASEVERFRETAGFSETTVRRAADLLGVVKKGRKWSLPTAAAPEPALDQADPVEANETSSPEANGHADPASVLASPEATSPPEQRSHPREEVSERAQSIKAERRPRRAADGEAAPGNRTRSRAAVPASPGREARQRRPGGGLRPGGVGRNGTADSPGGGEGESERPRMEDPGRLAGEEGYPPSEAGP